MQYESGACRACAGQVLADWEKDLMTNSGGFVESEETDNFPVVLICYRGEKAIQVIKVRMDSIYVQESRIPGYVDVNYELYEGNSMVTGTIPMVDYYTTE